MRSLPFETYEPIAKQWADPGPLEAWEALWAPQDEATYAAALAAIEPSDVVLDIGAGDLRLARRIAEWARQVIAWEIQPELVATGSQSLPANLVAIVADARTEPIPAGVTVAVLLMRHCTHYALYVEKLRVAGCRRLVTNARWGMGVEAIDLGPGVPFDSVDAGWYACRRCGAVGFVETVAALVDDATIENVADVEGCPACPMASRTCSGSDRLDKSRSPASSAKPGCAALQHAKDNDNAAKQQEDRIPGWSGL
jgi:SAM-dependent methyltransferase